MHILGFDTETTGLPNFRLPPDHTSQPRLVQLAGKLVKDNGDPDNFEEIAKFSFIIKPNGFTIPKEASDIHGTTTEKALKYGVPLISAMSIFSNLVAAADRVIAFNFRFDYTIIKRELKILNKPDRLASKEQFCPMAAVTDMCKLPPTDKMVAAGMGGKYKSPKLIEAHEFFFGEGFEGAHDAMADVDAMFRNYPFATGQKDKAA